MAETPKYSPDGKPLNEAARKELNKAIKNSAQATQNTLNARKQSGKTRIGKLAGGFRGGLGGGGMNWQTK
jgi:hypothetical protein